MLDSGWTSGSAAHYKIYRLIQQLAHSSSKKKSSYVLVCLCSCVHRRNLASNIRVGGRVAPESARGIRNFTE